MMNVYQLRSSAFALFCASTLAACNFAAQPNAVAPTAVAPPTSVTTPAATSISTRPQSSVVVTSGAAVPQTNVTISFPIDATITEVLVEEGQWVQEGDALARVDTRQLQIDLQTAELQAEQIRLRIEAMKAGPVEQEVALKQAQIESARADLQRAITAVSAQDIASAQASLTANQQSLAEVKDGPRAEDVAIAQADLDRSRAALQQVRDQLSSDKTTTELRLEQLANDIRDQQDTYSRIYWRNREIEKNDQLAPSQKDEEASALRAVQNAQDALESARITYEEAQKSELTRSAQIETEVKAAEARLVKLLNGPEQSDLIAAEALITRSAATLEQLTGPSRDAAIASARARVGEAEAALTLLLAAPSENALAQASVSLQLAQLQLKQARLALEEATLSSPIDGTIAIINMRVGDSSKGTSIQIADYSGWRVETDSLNELDVVHIREGAQASITFVALPNVELTGTVDTVRLVKQADGTIAYRALIVPDSWDDRLRWNMSASVIIKMDE